MTVLTIFVGIIALCNLVLLVGFALLAFSLKKAVDKGVVPTLSEVRNAVKGVNKFVGGAEEKAERIMQIGEDTARKLSGSVIATSEVVQQTVASPFISVSSLLTGISKAVQTWRTLSARPSTGGNQ